MLGPAFLTALVLIFLFGVRPAGASNMQVSGELALPAGFSTGNQTLSLTGDWGFYWQQLLTAEDFSRQAIKPDLLVQVPSVWNAYQLDGRNLPGFGYATYRLQVTGADKDQPLSLYIDSASTAYRLFVDDQLLAQNGQVSSSPADAQPYNQPRRITFRPVSDSFDILIQVSNFTYARGGLWYELYLGPPAALEKMLELYTYKDAILLGGLLFLALYHLNLFILLHETVNGLLLFLIDLIMATRITLYGDYLILRLFPALSYRLQVQINYLTLYLGPVVFYFLVMNLFFKPQRWTILERLILMYAIAISTATLMIPVALFTNWLPLIEGLILFLFGLSVFRIWEAARHNQRGASAILMTTGWSGILIIHDFLYQQNVIISPLGELNAIGLVSVVLMLSVQTAGRLMENYHERRILENRLSQSKETELNLKAQIEQFMMQRQEMAQSGRIRAKILALTSNTELSAQLRLIMDQPSLEPLVTDQIETWLDPAKLFSIDVVVLDLRISSETGFQILQKIRQTHSPVDLPILLLVHREQTSEVTTGIGLGANDTVDLPLDKDVFLTRLWNLTSLKSWVNRAVSSELAFLQAQIKPHFVFNALSVIASSCLQSPAKAKELLLDLSDYLRESFDFDARDGMTTLNRELKLVKAYLSIEQARFQSRVQINYDIDPRAQCSLPILSIQPIVENALRHGLLNRKSGGIVKIQVQQNLTSVLIRVSDNGRGISGEQLKQIMDLSSGAQGVGLKNIHRRLLAYYGNGLQFDSVEGRGTAVWFEIPGDQGKKEDIGAERLDRGR